MNDDLAELYDFTANQVGGFGPAPLADFEEGDQ